MIAVGRAAASALRTRMSRNAVPFVLTFLATAAALIAQNDADAQGSVRRAWTVDGVEREALVFAPRSSDRERAKPPLVFVFHGHGGSMRSAARSFALHRGMPEAVVVYAQGLQTPSARDPEGQRAGWQSQEGEQGDRDLEFVDAMLASLRAEFDVDERHIHATGHSNGGGFTYLVWATRSETIASIAPSSSGATRKLAGRDPIARPILHLAGRNDQVVSFDNQQRTIEALVRNAQASVGEPWAEVRGATLHRAKNGAHVATWFHDGGHELPDEGWRAVAAFLRRTPMPEAWTTESTIAPGLVQRTYASRAARTFVSYHVLVPAGYDHAENAERRYPVVMWLHGSGGGEAGLAQVARDFETAIARGAIPPVLVVFPNGKPQGMWCDNVDGSSPVETVTLDEVLPQVEAVFRTLASREGRVVMGFSMGGYGALRFAMARPQTFVAACSLGGGPLQQQLVEAPRVNEARRIRVLEETYGGSQEEFEKRSPWRLAEQNASALQNTRLLLVCGTEDETLPANRAMHDRLTSLGIAHSYVELQGVAHEPVRSIRALGPQLWAFIEGALR